MRSKLALDSAIRRYLAQQIELGGDEVVMSRAPAPRKGGTTSPSSETRTPEIEAPIRRAAQAVIPSVASPVIAAANSSPVKKRSSDWRVGAPSIPGPGIIIPGSLAPPQWQTLDEVAASVALCRKCILCQARTKVVPGEGNPEAEMVFVGEGPGQTEDETGRPFVGRAGELLTDILKALGLRREDIFICNAVKCRPPQNRKPLPDEIAACGPYLETQLALLRPKVIVALGGTATEALLGVKRPLTELRGRVHSYHGIPLVATYHPAALLRNPNWKKPAWDDVRIARQLVER